MKSNLGNLIKETARFIIEERIEKFFKDTRVEQENNALRVVVSFTLWGKSFLFLNCACFYYFDFS
jgi:hypothetical protein